MFASVQLAPAQANRALAAAASAAKERFCWCYLSAAPQQLLDGKDAASVSG